VSTIKLLLLAIAITFVAGCMSEDRPDDVHYVSSKPELAHCNKEASVDEREACYLKTSLDRSSDLLCMEIGTLSKRNLCLQKVVIVNNDPVVCQKIERDDMRYTECITRV